MNWPRLRNHLVNHYHERPQDVAKVDHWLALVKEGMTGLASLGHVYHLAAGPEPSRDDWPRLVYHTDKAPQGFMCLCVQDYELLGGREGGWCNTLDEAKHAKATEEQWKRGGIFPKAGLPAVTDDERTPLDRRRAKGLE